MLGGIICNVVSWWWCWDFENRWAPGREWARLGKVVETCQNVCFWWGGELDRVRFNPRWFLGVLSKPGNTYNQEAVDFRDGLGVNLEWDLVHPLSFLLKTCNTDSPSQPKFFGVARERTQDKKLDSLSRNQMRVICYRVGCAVNNDRRLQKSVRVSGDAPHYQVPERDVGQHNKPIC